jgi:hypothetical protein
VYLPDELLDAGHGATAFEDLGCYKMLSERRQSNENVKRQKTQRTFNPMRI